MSLKTRSLLVLSCVAMLGVGFAAGRYEAPLRAWLTGLSSPSQLKEPAPVVTPPIATAPAAEDAERPSANIDYTALKTLTDLDQGQEAFITGLRRSIKVAVGAQAEALHRQALAAAQQGDLAQATDRAEAAVALGDTTLWLPLAGWKRQNQSTDEALRFAWQAVRDARETPEQAAAYRLVGDLLRTYADPVIFITYIYYCAKFRPEISL